MENKDEANQIMNCIGALGCLLGRTFAAKELHVWTDNLISHNAKLPEIRKACRHFSSKADQEFMPTFPKFLAVAKGSIDYAAHAIDAWDTVTKLVTSRGYRWMCENQDKYRTYAMDVSIQSVGGLSALAYNDTKQQGFMRSAFLKTYETAMERNAMEESDPNTPKISEEQAAQNRMRISEIVQNMARATQLNGPVNDDTVSKTDGNGETCTLPSNDIKRRFSAIFDKLDTLKNPGDDLAGSRGRRDRKNVNL